MTIECSRCGGNHMRSECPTLGTHEAEIERLRKALNQIAWMDEFLSADAAREMMNIARDALAGVVGGQSND
jgi:hypothetical protein